jgi:hypothetical protein
MSQAGHPESPERITVIERTLSADSRLRSLQRLPPPSGGWDAPRVRAALELVHPPQYLDRLAQICSGLQAPTMIDDSTYVCPGSFKECCEARPSEHAAPTCCGCMQYSQWLRPSRVPPAPAPPPGAAVSIDDQARDQHAHDCMHWA